LKKSGECLQKGQAAWEDIKPVVDFFWNWITDFAVITKIGLLYFCYS